jgi:hypothetical protein
MIGQCLWYFGTKKIIIGTSIQGVSKIRRKNLGHLFEFSDICGTSVDMCICCMSVRH